MFIAYNNDLITEIADTEEELLQKLQFRVYSSIEETEEIYVYCNGVIMTEKQAQEEHEREERERKSKLKMTKRDFFLYVVKPYGVEYSALNQALQANDTMNACFNLCNHVYRYDEMLIGAIKPMLEALTGQPIDEQQLMEFLDEQFELHNAQD